MADTGTKDLALVGNSIVLASPGTMMTAEGTVIMSAGRWYVGMVPVTEDRGALGASGYGWGDLYLASGGTIDFSTSNVVIAHAASQLGITGASNIGLHGLTYTKGVVSTKTSAAGYTLGVAQVTADAFTQDTTSTGPIAGTLPTGTEICAAIPGYAVGDSWTFTYANPGNQTFTLTAAASGTTLVGTMTIATLNVKTFKCVITGANAVSIYSMGTAVY
jgi:hypothetical protein